MPSNPVSAVIAGAGLMGRWHAHAIARAGGMIVGVVDSDSTRAESLAKQCNARPFGRLADALAAPGDGVVHVCTPLDSHVSLIRESLASGWNVIAEKPVAATGAETRALADAATAARRMLVPVHQFLFQSGMLELLEVLPSLGDIVHIDAGTASAGADGPGRASPETVAAEIVPHFLALTERILSAPVAPRHWSLVRPRHGEWRVGTAIGRTSVSYNISMSSRPTFAELRILGTSGSAHLDLFHGFAVFENGRVSRRAKMTRPFDVAGRSFALAAMNLARRAIRGEPAYPGLAELITRTYEAIRSGGVAPISLASTVDVADARDVLMQLAAGIEVRPEGLEPPTF